MKIAGWVLAGVVVIAVVLVWAGYLNLTDYGDNTSLQELAGIAGLSFPKSTRLIHATSTGFIDTQIDAAISMDGKDVEGFIKSAAAVRHTPGKDAMQRSRTDRLGVTNNIGGATRWWNPDSAKAFEAIHIERAWNRGQSLQILIDTDDPTRAVVYIRYFGE